MNSEDGKTLEQKKEEIKKKILLLIEQYQIPLTWKQFLDSIYFENSNQDLHNLAELFIAKTGSIEEANKNLMIISNAWNYFPHQTLKGLSPVEMIGNNLKQKENYFDPELSIAQDQLNEQEMIKILEQGSLNPEEMSELITAMMAKGMRGSIMTVDNPDSEEGRAAKEYIDYHQKLPKTYPNLPEKNISQAKKTLLHKSAKLEKKKKAMIILAHTGRLDAYQTLEKYEKNPDPKLKIWINMAIQECQMFLESDLLDRSTIGINKISTIGRNDPCSCGSNKKYKKCCGKVQK